MLHKLDLTLPVTEQREPGGGGGDQGPVVHNAYFLLRWSISRELIQWNVNTGYQWTRSHSRPAGKYAYDNVNR
jgi:hypothetical protein